MPRTWATQAQSSPIAFLQPPQEDTGAAYWPLAVVYTLAGYAFVSNFQYVGSNIMTLNSDSLNTWPSDCFSLNVLRQFSLPNLSLILFPVFLWRCNWTAKLSHWTSPLMLNVSAYESRKYKTTVLSGNSRSYQWPGPQWLPICLLS